MAPTSMMLALAEWASACKIQRRSSSESQDNAVWASCTWPMLPPLLEEGKLEPHITGLGVKASMTCLNSSLSGGVGLALGPRLVLEKRGYLLDLLVKFNHRDGYKETRIC